MKGREGRPLKFKVFIFSLLFNSEQLQEKFIVRTLAGQQPPKVKFLFFLKNCPARISGLCILIGNLDEIWLVLWRNIDEILQRKTNGRYLKREILPFLEILSKIEKGVTFFVCLVGLEGREIRCGSESKAQRRE